MMQISSCFSLLLFIFQIPFHCGKSQEPSAIKGYIVELKFPMFDTLNNEWYVKEYNPQFTRLYYFKDKILVQRSSLSASIVAVDNVVIKQNPRRVIYDSFIFSKSIGVGMLCDSNNLKTAKLVNKDSVLKNVWVLKDDLKGIFQSSHHKLISSKTEPNGDLVEEYSLVEKRDTAMKGSCALRFTKRDKKASYFQLSPFIENDRQMKLVEYTTVVNARMYETQHMLMNRFELPTKLSELKIENEAELLAMFELAGNMLK